MGILAVSSLNGLDLMLGLGWVPDGPLTDPVYLVSAFGCQLLVAATALFVAVPRGERLYLAPVVPLYLFYAIAHVVPVTVGYLNWFSLTVFGRRLWGDHYQDEASLRVEVAQRRSVVREEHI
jgi:hypothetical protein